MVVVVQPVVASLRVVLVVAAVVALLFDDGDGRLAMAMGREGTMNRTTDADGFASEQPNALGGDLH